MKIKLTYELAMAAGQDVANKRMRKANRKSWNREDYNAAAIEVNRLFALAKRIERAEK